jgi:hypothetical protein
MEALWRSRCIAFFFLGIRRLRNQSGQQFFLTLLARTEDL